MNDRSATLRTARMACLVFAVALFAPLTSFAQEAAAPKKVVSLEGITEYRLDNGLRVLLFPDESTPKVTVNLTVFVGSRHEGYGETGMAHLLEHMLFKGCKLYPDSAAIPKALKDRGADFNGTTWVDRTNYYEIMTGSDANLEFGIRLEADRMVNSFIRREDLASEMTVVRNEFEMGENNPSSILRQRMLAVAYEWHNYGKYTIGNRTDIERVPIERLQAFYKKYYRPDNAMLVVAGKFDDKKALQLVAKNFGAIKNPPSKLENTYTEEPAQDGERQVVLRRVGKVGVVGAMYHIPAGAHEDFPAVEILKDVLVSQPSGRLYKALVPTKMATSVSGLAFPLHDPGMIEVTAQVDPGKPLEAVRDTMLDVLEKLADHKITAEEVDRAKTKFKVNRDQLMEDANHIGITLSEWGAQGDWRLFFLHRDRIAKVTPEDVQRVAQKYLQRPNRTLGMFVPTEKSDRTTIPGTPVVADLVKDYKGGETVVSGEAFEPTPENIEKRVKRVVPKEGVKVALLPKKTRGESVTLDLGLRYGNEKSLKGQNKAAQFLGALMLRGTEKHTRQQLQDELAKLGATLNATGSAGELTFSLQAKKKTLPQVLALLTEVLRSPSFPADEFDILKRGGITGIKRGMTEPTALAFRALQRQLNPYPKDDVRYYPTYEEDLANLEATTLDQVKQLYAKQLGGQSATLVVVGDVEMDALQPLLKELNGWKTDTAYERIARPGKLDGKGGKEVIQTPDKAQAFYLTAHKFGLTDRDPEYAALSVANFLFGEAPLASRLSIRIRGKMGLSYGAVSVFNADARDKNASFIMYALCNPDGIDKVETAAQEELALLLKDGIPAKELDEAKKALLEQIKTQRGSDDMLAALLKDGLQEDRTFKYHAELEKKIAGLTADEVIAAVRKHWDPKKLYTIRAGDFNKKK